MIQSMTGYGEASVCHIHCEIKSLNHRFFNLNLSMPSSLSVYEFRLRKLLKAAIKRGSVFLRIFLDDMKIQPDIKRAQIYYKFVNDLKKKLKLGGPVPLELFLDFKKEVTPSWQLIRSVINSAVAQLTEARVEEGKKLQKDIELRLNKIEKLLEFIKKRVSKQKDERGKHLMKKLPHFIKDKVNESKFSNELALLMMKEDFSEECIRLVAHLSKFRRILKARESSGKYLGFLTQEMHREANTISSKASDTKISHAVVELKSELEAIREQIENAR